MIARLVDPKKSLMGCQLPWKKKQRVCVQRAAGLDKSPWGFHPSQGLDGKIVWRLHNDESRKIQELSNDFLLL